MKDSIDTMKLKRADFGNEIFPFPSLTQKLDKVKSKGPEKNVDIDKNRKIGIKDMPKSLLLM